MRYMKMSEDLLSNAKVREAGTDAALVFYEILAINSRGSRDGVLTARESSARFIWGTFAPYGWDEARVAAALAACVKAELVHVLLDKTVTIDGWDDFWRPPMTDKQRAKASRDRRRDVSQEVRDARHDASVTASREHRTRVTTRQTDRQTDTSSSLSSSVTVAEPGEGGREEVRSAWSGAPLVGELNRLGVFTANKNRQWSAAARLVEAGVTLDELRALATMAAAQGDKPAGLLATWLSEADALAAARERLKAATAAAGPQVEPSTASRPRPSPEAIARGRAMDGIQAVEPPAADPIPAVDVNGVL